jgi:5-methyltetrahydrofolate--homocysteine methyltransferase
MEETIRELQNALYAGDKAKAAKITKQALAGGMAPLKLIEEGMRPGLTRVGEAFELGELFLPELVGAGDAALAVSDLIADALEEGEEIPLVGTVAVGTVKGDIHSIGKGMVTTMMRVNGFDVIDLGVDVSPEEFLAVASQVDAIGLSSLISLSTKSMEETIRQLKAKSNDTVIIIGGAAVDPTLAKTFGVLYGADAASAPSIVAENINKR